MIGLVIIVIAALFFAVQGGGGVGTLAADPTDFNGLVNKGNTAFDGKNWAKAEDLYSRALALNPDDNNVRTDYGVSLYYQGKVDAAISEYQTVLTKEPTKYQTLLNLGIALVDKNPPDTAGALAAWQKVVDKAPDAATVEQARSKIAQYRK